MQHWQEKRYCNSNHCSKHIVLIWRLIVAEIVMATGKYLLQHYSSRNNSARLIDKIAFIATYVEQNYIEKPN